MDIGCGHGDFLVERARARPDLNVVGLEIRRPMAERVQARIAREGLKNAAAVFCSANLHLEALFAPGALRRAYVHFPDPWFKKKHHKRRLVTPALLDALARALAPDGELRFMTDHGEYADEVAALVEARADFENAHGPGREAPPDPSLPASHREAWHVSQGDPVWRYVWRKRAG